MTEFHKSLNEGIMKKGNVNSPPPDNSRPLGNPNSKNDIMYKTKQEYAKSILQDVAIVEQFDHAECVKDYEKIAENIIAKYEMMKILR